MSPNKNISRWLKNYVYVIDKYHQLKKKNLDVTHINLPIQHTHRGQLNIFTSRFLFYSIIRNYSIKLQNNFHEKQNFNLKGNSIATNLKCEIFFLYCYIHLYQNEIINLQA